MEKVTEVVVILDRSGSMQGMTNDTIGGFNQFLSEQKKLEGQAFLTLILFDDKYEVVYNSVNIHAVPELTKGTYFTRGNTALWDAVGKSVSTFSPKANSKVIFAITTDGEENSSHEYKAVDVKKLVSEKQEEGWQFLFVGANIDSFAVGGGMGMKLGNTSNYTQTSRGTQSVYTALNLAVTDYREKGIVDEGWTNGIE